MLVLVPRFGNRSPEESLARRRCKTFYTGLSPSCAKRCYQLGCVAGLASPPFREVLLSARGHRVASSQRGHFPANPPVSRRGATRWFLPQAGHDGTRCSTCSWPLLRQRLGTRTFRSRRNSQLVVVQDSTLPLQQLHPGWQRPGAPAVRQEAWERRRKGHQCPS